MSYFDDDTKEIARLLLLVVVALAGVAALTYAAAFSAASRAEANAEASRAAPTAEGLRVHHDAARRVTCFSLVGRDGISCLPDVTASPKGTP